MTDARTLAELGDLVAQDGPAGHDVLLQRLSALVTETAPGTAAALADRNSPAVVRQRALARASEVLLRRSTSIPTELGLAA